MIVENGITHRYLRLASFGGVVGSPKGQMQCKNCQRSGYTQRVNTHTGASRVGFPFFLWMLHPAGTALVLWQWGKPHCELPWLLYVERSESGSWKAGDRARPNTRRLRPHCRSEISAGTAICRADGTGRGLQTRSTMGRVVTSNSTPRLIEFPRFHRSRRLLSIQS